MLFSRNCKFAAVVGTIAAGAALPAYGQFVNGITKPLFGQNPPLVYLTDVSAGTSTLLYDASALPSTAGGFGGLAADEPNRRLFGTVRNGTKDDLYAIDYDTLTPTLVGGLSFNGGNLSVDSLAYDTSTGTLYATKLLGGSTGAEAIYAINPANAQASLVFEYDTGSTNAFFIGAIDYEPTTGLIYLANDDNTDPGIYSFDPANPSAGLSFVTAYGTGITDVDGLGAGNGKLYLLSDGNPDGNGGSHFELDLATLTYTAVAPSPHPPYTTGTPLGRINPSGSGAFAPGLIPEPTSLTALTLAAAGLLRRRR